MPLAQVTTASSDNEVIYPLRVSSTLLPDRHVDLLLFEHDGVQHNATIRDFSRLVGRQLSSHGHTVVYTSTLARSCWTLTLPTFAMLDQISQGPTLPVHQHPQTAVGTVCSIR